MRWQLGQVVQNGFVVEDLTAAIEHWTQNLGVGPFFEFRHLQFSELYFEGQPTTLDISAAISYFGDIQIELIQQHSEGRSVYTDKLGKVQYGLHHMGVFCDSIDATLGNPALSDIPVVFNGKGTNGTRFTYLDTACHPGGVVELIEAGPELLQGFSQMKSLCDRWDGTPTVIEAG